LGCLPCSSKTEIRRIARMRRISIPDWGKARRADDVASDRGSALADIWHADSRAAAAEWQAGADAASAGAAAVGRRKRRAEVERLARLAGDWFG
jgi:hypothetical protein